MFKSSIINFIEKTNDDYCPAKDDVQKGKNWKSQVNFMLGLMDSTQDVTRKSIFYRGMA